MKLSNTQIFWLRAVGSGTTANKPLPWQQIPKATFNVLFRLGLVDSFASDALLTVDGLNECLERGIYVKRKLTVLSTMIELVTKGENK